MTIASLTTASEASRGGECLDILTDKRPAAEWFDLDHFSGKPSCLGAGSRSAESRGAGHDLFQGVGDPRLSFDQNQFGIDSLVPGSIR